MAGFITDEALDAGLDYLITNGSRIDIIDNASGEPTTYALATTDNANSIGNKLSLTLAATSDGPTDGRKTQVPAITDGNITENDTAGFWALTDNVSLLLATGPLTATQVVTDLNTFSLDAIDLRFRDATSV